MELAEADLPSPEMTALERSRKAPSAQSDEPGRWRRSLKLTKPASAIPTRRFDDVTLR